MQTSTYYLWEQIKKKTNQHNQHDYRQRKSWRPRLMSAVLLLFLLWISLACRTASSLRRTHGRVYVAINTVLYGYIVCIPNDTCLNQTLWQLFETIRHRCVK